jgi:carbamoyl-phosphate synthase large subunit
MTEPVTVLVTAVGGIGTGEQILKSLRLARPGRWHIIAADVNAWVPQFAMADQAVKLPSARDPAYMTALETVCRHFGVRAVFHGSEAEMMVLARERERILSWGVLPMINEPLLIALCKDKAALAARLTELGFQLPRTVKIRSAMELAAVERFPVIVKPVNESGGSRNIQLARNQRELELVLSLLEGTERFLVQEYVGRPEEEYTVGVLHDAEKRFIAASVLRRDLTNLLNVSMSVPNTTGREDLGPMLVISSGISAGTFGPHPEIVAQCRAMAEALGSCGPLNFQLRFVNGQVRLFEINPRYSGTTSLRALAGVNEVDLMLRAHVLGEDIPRGLSPRPIRIVRTLIETEEGLVPAPSWRQATQV